VATVDVLGPFEVVKRSLTLPPLETKPPAGRGLVAWWKFDETAGVWAADATGNRLQGRVQGVPRWSSPGRIGGAWELGGAGGYVDCGGVEDFNFRYSMTVSAWIKVRQADKQASALITKGNDTWLLQMGGEKRLVSFALTGPQTTGASKGKASAVKSKRLIDDGQWHHLAAVYDGQRIALYLDGVLEDSVTASGPIAVNTEPVVIGQNADGRSASFNGWVDDVQLHDRGLSAGEVQALYRGGAGTNRASK